jgi:ferredoxin-NADP reductase
MASSHPFPFTAELMTHRDLAPDIFELTFRLHEPTRIKFRPGQFVSVRVSPTVWRVYSIASAPTREDGREFQLCIKLFKEKKEDGAEYIGKGSGYLKNLQVGDVVEFFGPGGNMPFEADDQDDLILAGTGTGLAPLKSIAEYLTDLGSSRKMRLYLGVRFVEDVFYVQDMQELARRNPNFKFIHACSRAPEDHPGRCGRLPDILAADYPDGVPAGTTAYICGGTKSSYGIRSQLVKLGMPEEKVHVEGFGG